MVERIVLLSHICARSRSIDVDALKSEVQEGVVGPAYKVPAVEYKGCRGGGETTSNNVEPQLQM